MAYSANLDKIIGIVTVALGLLALAAGLSTDAYSHGAQAEARSYNDLTHLIVGKGSTLCLNSATHNRVQPAAQEATQ